MKNIYIIASIFGAALLSFTAYYYIRNPLVPKIKVGRVTFVIEIAVRPEEKEKGLGGRDSLAAGTGMLFPYDHKERYRFWMKGMRFPLDFVWITDQKVIDVTENVPPPSGEQIATVQPRVPVSQILELNAGEVKKYRIKIGDPVSLLTK